MAKRVVGKQITRPSGKPGEGPITFPVAKDLLKVDGIPIRDNEVSFYSREYPLESVAVEQSASTQWANEVRIDFSPETDALYESFRKEISPAVDWIRSSGELIPDASPSGDDVSEAIRQKAYELGYGEAGFTRFDRRYLYQSRRSEARSDLSSAICLALEQDFAATQEIPGIEAEMAQGDAYLKQAELSKQLVEYILSLGYSAQVSGPVWHFGPMIPMFVEAGLGQLGVNGQLLSPKFGSRARLQIILTNAKVTFDKPVDYGIYKYCESCQICFTRCPGRALQGERVWYRGVEKHKLIFKRCRPVMTRYDGCGVCMKVCPIQKYGMKPVMEHYVETGEILGKGSDNLEGYTLGDKGYFPPGKLPHFDRDFFDMPTGRAEDRLIEDFKEKLRNGKNGGGTDSEEAWTELRETMEASVDDGPKMMDMGMDFDA